MTTLRSGLITATEGRWSRNVSVTNLIKGVCLSLCACLCLCACAGVRVGVCMGVGGGGWGGLTRMVVGWCGCVCACGRAMACESASAREKEREREREREREVEETNKSCLFVDAGGFYHRHCCAVQLHETPLCSVKVHSLSMPMVVCSPSGRKYTKQPRLTPTRDIVGGDSSAPGCLQ